MTSELPEQRPQGQTPEGRLLQRALEADGRSIRQVAAAAGMSDTRWRQIVKGWMQVSPGVHRQVTARAAVLARMAYVVGVTPEALREVGRDDAADILGNPDALSKVHDSADYTISTAIESGAIVPADEIDMIYESSMTAEQKLKAIRQVLQLRAQAEQERGKQRAQQATAPQRAKAPLDDDTSSASSGQNS